MQHARLLTATALAMALAAGCKRDTPSEAPATAAATAPATATDARPSPGALAPGFDVAAFVGEYVGTLPCADCPGIDTSISFAADGGFAMHELYQDEDGSLFDVQGGWQVQADGKRLLLHPDDKRERDRWFEVVAPGEIRALTPDGQRIDSKLDYSLRRR